MIYYISKESSKYGSAAYLQKSYEVEVIILLFYSRRKRYCRLDCMSDCSISFRARLFYCGKIYFPVGSIGGCKNDKSSN